MPKDDAIGAPREIPANRLLLRLRTGLRSGAIGALRAQRTGVAGPLGLHARRETQALEPVTVLKAALDGARARTPANRHFRISMWGSDREPLVPLRTQMTEEATQMTGAGGPLRPRPRQAEARAPGTG